MLQINISAGDLNNFMSPPSTIVKAHHHHHDVNFWVFLSEVGAKTFLLSIRRIVELRKKGLSECFLRCWAMGGYVIWVLFGGFQKRMFNKTSLHLLICF